MLTQKLELITITLNAEMWWHVHATVISIITGLDNGLTPNMPLLEPLLTYFQSDNQNHNSMKFGVQAFKPDSFEDVGLLLTSEHLVTPH